jgi:hypothetical protein
MALNQSTCISQVIRYAANLKCGDVIAQGQVLAQAGTTGWSTGIHLHFETSLVHTGAAT